MVEIDLIKSLEKISSTIPNRILKIEGHIFKGNCKEFLEIIIYKGFSSSTTHPIEIDLEKKVIDFNHSLSNFKLFKAPLNKKQNEIIRISQNPLFFLDKSNWI